MQSELKPCPFCGSDRLMVLPPTCDRDTPYSAADRAFPVVRCSGCYTDVPGKDFDASSKSAVEAWNRRSLTAALSDKQAGEVKIKPLEWRQAIRNGTYLAHGIGILYAVDEDHECAVLAKHEGSSVTKSAHPHAEAAKAAAQTDYEQRIRSALVDVPAIEPVGDDLVGYVLRYGGMCRDCADMDGVCQSGQPCDTDQRRAVVKHTVAALAYGIKHGFIANPFTSPPLSREGEDSAEVERLRDALEKISDGYGPNHLSAFCRNTAAEALAATRSASATKTKGCVE